MRDVMFTNETYHKKILNLNMFYLRIQKEHAYFLQTLIPPKQADLIKLITHFHEEYQYLIQETMNIGAGILEVSDYMVTNYTLSMEKLTAFLTGHPIDTDLTILELNLATQPVIKEWDKNLKEAVTQLNQKITSLNREFIKLHNDVLEMVSACGILLNTYPSFLLHMKEELIHYNELLPNIISYFENDNLKFKSIEFWNNMMLDHAIFTHSFLDPKNEIELLSRATTFINSFEQLSNRNNLTIKLTEDFRDFIVQITEGIFNCEISSMMNPLYCDHILREVNFYLYLLKYSL